MLALLVGLSVASPAAASGLLDKAKDLLGDAGKSLSPNSLSEAEIGDGLKEALRVGTEAVVAQLGAVDGFNADDAIHIPLPGSLQTVKDTLSKFGMGDMLDDLETRLNRAAEAATPKAKALFWDAIQAMSLEDIRGIYEGPQDAATQYFQAKMGPGLADEMRPIIDQSLAEVGAIKAFDDVMAEYKNLPLVPDVKADLNDYVVEKGMDGIFHYVAEEEAAIRADPAKRTTELLQKVFSQ